MGAGAGYTVYRSGEPDPIRFATVPQRDEPPEPAASAADAALPRSLRAAPPARTDRRRAPTPERGGGGGRGYFILAAALAAAAAAVALFWFYGRQPVEDAVSVLDLARTSGRLPGWLLVVAPVAAAIVLAGIVAYLAFGRHLSLKIVGMVAVVAALAAPGFALGWTNGTLNTVGNKSPGVSSIVRDARAQLQPELPHKAVNILLIGSDTRPGDPGRSDTQVVMRLDPVTKTISMLSVPRDLLVDIPGHGQGKINSAYTLGGPALTVETVSQLTGLPIHHFIEVNFAGFWHSVNILGGVYYSVDHRYYNPEGQGYQPINLQPGYQLMHGKDALNWVRFRHDQKGDFTRMLRQQSFLKELQRQSGRWNHDWTKVTKLIRAITAETTSDLDSLHRILPLASLVLTLNTTHVSMVHIEGSTPTINGTSYVVATPEEIRAAVEQFSAPTERSAVTRTSVMPKKTYEVLVYNANGVTGQATAAAAALTNLGYHAHPVTTLPTTYPSTVVEVPHGMEGTAQQFLRLFSPAELKVVGRRPGTRDGVTVYLGANYDGSLNAPPPVAPTDTLTVTMGRYDEAGWRALDAQTRIKLQMPGVWISGAHYDQFRAYTIPTLSGKNSSAAVAVGMTSSGDYFSFQAMRWLNPPAIADPTERRTIGGTQYLLFYNGAQLHMVAWKRGNTLYWVLNSLDDKLPERVMLSLATSFEPL